MSDHVSDLQVMRNTLLKCRRAIATLAASDPQNIGEYGNDIVVLQQRINVVDDAIADEQAIARRT